MEFIIKEEIEKKDILSKLSVGEDNLVLPENYEYKSTIDVGDIVKNKGNNKLGVVSFLEEDEITIIWEDNNESIETNSNIVVIPSSIGLKLIKNKALINLWEELSNGKNDSFDLKCIYIGDKVINEVPFIKSFKNTNTIIDKRFKRNFTLYRKFGNYQIFRTNLYTITNNKVMLDTSRYVYYLLQDNTIYYLGIDLNENDLTQYLFNR